MAARYAAADLLRLIAVDILAGCPHDEPDEAECPECQDQRAADAAEYRAYAYH
ncbi:hypothetical protein [Kitasatospora sp. NPDC001132]